MSKTNLTENREGMARGAEDDFRSSLGGPQGNAAGPKLSDMMKSYRGWWNLPHKGASAPSAPTASRREAGLRGTTP
jgi:hypothetical protein